MNGLDIFILAAIGLGAIHGFARGVLRIASSLIALVAAAYLSSLYSHRVDVYLVRAFGVRPVTASVLGYALIFIAVMVCVAWAGGKIAALVRAVHMSWADRLGGAVVGAGMGVLFAGLVVALATVTLSADSPIIRQSQLAPHFLKMTYDLANFIPPEIRDSYNHQKAQFIGYWNLHMATPPGPAGSTAAP
jgi:membrane protein required for colicin V production